MAAHAPADFASRLLDAAGPLPVDELEAKLLLAGVETALFGVDAAPALVGRYRVERRVGQGGGGTVYRGYDPRLRRPVAIKVLRIADPPPRDGLQRLRREARALARLNHPNVVQIYDVLQPSACSVVVVMEWVPARTLEHWLREQPRSASEILRVFEHAGRGLAAAHLAGLVHRDFKPSNVLLGHGGAVKVADFGLARGAPPDASTSHGPHDPVSPGAPSTLGRITRPGGVVGTPAYMAPEQHRGVVDARADQYAFCASLYEALCARLPPAADSADAMHIDRQLAQQPGRRGVPRHVAAALRRGLSSEPAQRFASMTALLAALRPRSHRRNAWIAGALGGLTITGALAWGGAPGDEAQTRCEAEANRVQRSWDARALDVRRGFEATGLPYAAAAFHKVESRLSAHAARWGEHYATTCEAAVSPQRLDRQRCLQRQAWDTDSLIEQLALADARLVRVSTQAVTGLPSPEQCALPDLASWLPTDLEAQARAEQLHQRLSDVRAHHLAGRYGGAAALAESVIRDAEAAALPALAILARLQLGRARVLDGDLEQGRTTLTEAYWAAIAAGHQLEASDAATSLAFTVGYKLAELDQGRTWGRHAEALHERLQVQGERAAELWSHLGSLESLAGQFEQAIGYHERALAVREPLAEEDPVALATTLNNLGNVWVELGKPDQARGFHQRALQLRRDAVGEAHPLVAISLNNLASVALLDGDSTGACETLERALTSWENAVGRDHPDLVLPLSNLAQAAIKAGDLPDAQAHAQRALAIAQDRLAADHPHRALAHHIAGKVALEAGRPDAALEHFLNAAEVSRAAFGSDHHNVAGAINEVGLALLALGRERAAVESFTEARRIWQAAFGDDHARVAMVSINLGEALVRLGDRSSARNALEPALEHPEFETFGDGQCSKAEFALARTLGPGDDEARRARDLAERAAARLREAQGRQHQVLEIEAWLHPRKKVPT